ncbi:DedA family protein [Solirubrobacter deserti]|uniref:DedA family protein n=1 Tax=Solirubrobacter deserti TaxID=2282478 RepID=A0ABT4RD62_9ACTN|nr:DedA family protein [Solirubrobacter deserti]MDA0136481.1 DedA family protein [Solirubrobacter deserti]
MTAALVSVCVLAAGVLLAGELADVLGTVGAWVYLAVPALIFLETTAFAGWLVHGELALLTGGVVIADQGVAALGLMIALVATAAVAGDLVSVTAGRVLGRPFLERRLPRAAAAVDGFFARHGGKALFLGRFTGLFRSTLPFVAGTSGVTVRRIVPYSVASAVIWSATFVTLGYAAAESFDEVGDTVSRVALIVLLVLAVALIARGRRRARRRGDAPATADSRGASAPPGP